MATTEKAISLTAELKDSLKRYFATVSDVQFDTDGNPFLTATQGTLAAGQQAVLVKVQPQASIQVDGLGLPQKVYAQHTMLVVLEDSTIANVALLTEGNKLLALAEVTGRGAQVKLYLSANGVAVSTAGITGTPVGQWDGLSLKYRGMAGT